MVGHARPLFLGFAKGGKAVATAGGTILGVAPLVGLIGAGLVDRRLRRHALRVRRLDDLRGLAAARRVGARRAMAGARLRWRGRCEP